MHTYKPQSLIMRRIISSQIAGMLANAYRASSHPYTPLADYAFDSVMALAHLLNGTLDVLENGNVEEDTGCQNQNGTAVPLEEFSFDNDLMGCLFLAVLRNLSFDGNVVRTYSTYSHT